MKQPNVKGRDNSYQFQNQWKILKKENKKLTKPNIQKTMLNDETKKTMRLNKWKKQTNPSEFLKPRLIP
jgi:hypothetical protein